MVFQLFIKWSISVPASTNGPSYISHGSTGDKSHAQEESYVRIELTVPGDFRPGDHLVVEPLGPSGAAGLVLEDLRTQKNRTPHDMNSLKPPQKPKD